MDPIGRWRDDYHMANLVTYMVNITRALYGTKGVAQSKPLDFMPEWGKPPRDSVAEMKQTLLSIAEEQNKKVAREREEEKNKLKKISYGSGKLSSNTGGKRGRTTRRSSLNDQV